MIDIIREPSLYIGGEWVLARGEEIEIENPATEQVIGLINQASVEDAVEAISVAKDAFPAWSTTSAVQRVQFLRRLVEVLAERADYLADIINLEQGSPFRLARTLHVDVPLGVIRATADALEQFQFRTEIGNSLIFREPVGVVGAITPWNLPLHQVVAKVIPALAAGATVVLKPAILTPLVAYEFARAVAEAGLPAGVFNLVPGTGTSIGSLLARSPDIDQVSFTGSTPVGRTVAAEAATTVKRVTLELGGKSASVVLRDVSDELLNKAVKLTVANCYLNGGQTCTALSRLIVPSDRLEEVEQLAAIAAAKYIPGDRLGPLISAAQRQEVESFCDVDALSDAKLVYQFEDELPTRGYYVRPTVFSQVDPRSRLAQQEIFGPVLSIFGVESDADAIVLANDSEYGLGGAVWASSSEAALNVAVQIRTGQVDINGAAFNARAPFGGYKQSGTGRELGDFGISDSLEVKAVQR